MVNPEILAKQLWPPNTDIEGVLTVGAASAIVVVACVLMHYECLGIMTKLLLRLQALARTRIMVLMFALMGAHLIEIWIFAFGFFYLDGHGKCGALSGAMHEGILDYVYFSASTYTTLGYGDLVPVGPIRFLTALEALSGLLLIAWSSSFTFLEMNRFWKDR